MFHFSDLKKEKQNQEQNVENKKKSIQDMI